MTPLIGNAGVSAVPDAARVSQEIGLKYDTNNRLLMHAMGPTAAGVIGSTVAAGILLGFLGERRDRTVNEGAPDRGSLAAVRRCAVSERPAEGLARLFRTFDYVLDTPPRQKANSGLPLLSAYPYL